MSTFPPRSSAPFFRCRLRPGLCRAQGACLLLLCLGLLVLAVSVAEAQPVGNGMGNGGGGVVPERAIQLKEDGDVAWKTLWDEARQLVRQGRPEKAVPVYETLLAMRQGLELARWEFASLLLRLDRGRQALPHLEELVEASPGNISYLAALAETLFAQGNYARSVDIRKKILRHEPDNAGAREGLAWGLLRLGKKAEALLLFEELQHREPARTVFREVLAQLYSDLGLYDKARPHIQALAARGNAGPDLLRTAARLHDRLGLGGAAAEYWQRFLGHQPRNTEALEWLASYYQKEGRGEAALPHLTALLAGEPSSPQLLKRTGRLYFGLGRFAEALRTLERYIALKPGDREVLRLLVETHAALGNRSQSALTLARLLSLDPESGPENLEKAAGLYKENGRHREAADLYERILQSRPDEPEILAKYARARLAAGDGEKAAAMWAHLERRQKLLEVLEILAVLEPDNGEVLERLARTYLARGELARSLPLFARLEEIGGRSREVGILHASVYERLNHGARALALYERILAGGGDGEIRLRCLELAGRLGLAEKVRHFLRALREEEPEFHGREESMRRIAAALTRAGFFAAAQGYYEAILQRNRNEGKGEAAALLGLAELARRRGLPYEAEQYLRQAWLSGEQPDPVLIRLFDLALAEGRPDAARVWLAQLDMAGVATPAEEKKLLRARLLAAEGEQRAAIRMLWQLVRGADGQEGAENPSADLLLRRRADFVLAGLLLEQGQYGAAERIAFSLRDAGGDFAAPALLLRLHREQGRESQAGALLLTTLDEARQDQELFLAFMAALGEYGLHADLSRLAGEAALRWPASSAVRNMDLAARADGEGGDLIGALLAHVQDFPEDEAATVRLARLLFRNGRLDEALAMGEREAVRGRPDMLLLRARVLWVRQEWEESLAVYQAFLSPPVARKIRDRERQAGREPARWPEPGLWQRLTVPEFERQTPVDALMSPQGLFAADALPLRQTAASLYADYCWQRRFALEQNARQAIMRREYLAAAEHLGRLLREYPPDDSLRFDLAGLYSRFGQLAEEAALYENIAVSSLDFPGLAEARARNALKRRPRVSLGYGSFTEEGRDGYKAMEATRQTASLRVFPSLHGELDMDVVRSVYRDPDGEAKIRGTRALLSYTANVDEQMMVRVGGGAELLAKGVPDATVLDLAVERKLSDRLTGILSYHRDLNRDTLASIGRNIIQQDYQADLAVTLLPAVQVGGGYVYSDFSDDNSLQGYDLWAAYLLFLDPAFLKFSYSYDYKDSEQGPRPAGYPEADGFALADHPYWTPLHYWQNRFSLYFRHQLSDDQFKRGVPRYYDIEYTVAYDGKGYATQSLKGGFFVECSRNLILEATAELLSGQEHRAREFFLSAVYRW